MNKRSTFKNANGVRFVLSAKTSVLEPAGRASTLEAFGIFTDEQTKFSSCSIAALAALSRQSKRSIERALEQWRKPEMQDLVIDVSQKKGGPGEARLFRVHWERLRLIASAVGITRRAVGAGAYMALDNRNLIKAPATAANCAQILGVLQGKLIAESQHGPARRIERLQSRLAAVFDGWPGKVLDGAVDVEIRDDFGHVFGVGEDVDNLSNYDNLSANYDNLTPAHYKEDSPQGSLKARTPARGPVDIRRLHSQSTQAIDLTPLSLTQLAAIAGGGTRRRAEIAEALIGCQAVQLDGWLVIRTGGSGQCDQLHDVWFADLLTAAEELGYRGLFITDRTVEPKQSSTRSV